MILPDWKIKEKIGTGELKIDFDKELYIGPSSVDLHLSGTGMKLVNRNNFAAECPVISCLKNNDKLFKKIIFNTLTIYPGEFYILSTEEKIEFPKNLAGFIQGRSSVGRMGVSVQSAGFFDPGFKGTATLEVTNITQLPVTIRKRMRICQMVFMETFGDVKVAYGEKQDQKYNNQKGPTLSRIEFDGKII